MVRHPISPQYSVADIDAPPRTGKPPFDAKKMETLMPDRAGVKPTLRDKMLFIFRTLFALPRLFANRPSVVDARIHEAGVPCAICSFTVVHGH